MMEDAAFTRPLYWGTFLLWSLISLTFRVSTQVITRVASAMPVPSPHPGLAKGVRFPSESLKLLFRNLKAPNLKQNSSDLKIYNIVKVTR